MPTNMSPILLQWVLGILTILATGLVSVALYQLRRVVDSVDKLEDNVNDRLNDHLTRITVIEKQLYTPQERREIIELISSTKHIEKAVTEVQSTNRGFFKQLEEVKSLIREGNK